MPRIAQKTLVFPLAGVSRREGYRKQEPPYVTPWAINVRGECQIERRKRGGSRPGLAKVIQDNFGTITAISPISYVNSDGEMKRDLIVIGSGTIYTISEGAVTEGGAELLWCDGVPILWEDGEGIVFSSSLDETSSVGHSIAFDFAERNGKLFIADSVLREIDPQTGVIEDVQASAGAIPSGCPLVCLYRDRIFLAGSGPVWYASRQGDPYDWNFGGDIGDPGRAVAGQVERAGRISDQITAMIPRGDRALVIATADEMWVMRGEPTTGSLIPVSGGVGIVSPMAWALAPDGTAIFLSRDGLYMMSAGSTEHPVRWSEERLPDELREVDPDGKAISITYDGVGRGFHLFITPASGTGSHWWLDYERKAVWPVSLVDGHQPTAAVTYRADGLAEAIIGCKDGYIRKFDNDADDDDGSPLPSHVILGPFSTATGDISDAILAEIHGIMADASGPVKWRVVMGKSAEETADAAVAGILAEMVGEPIGAAYPEGIWGQGRNLVSRPRARGPWAAVWVSSSARWAFEAVALRIHQLGRLR